ncbi:acyl-CoA thioester hydrolase [Thermosulfidibacter takaii ABI70S6]|uniref:Acyl-CoA thioester hydrolase n=1 Tax=Thermosulfidibacter takaii (strain DSM 17441 / JCM 13301 / NBRC 103674 / ABI70S6) TaxID=1298851 RepID=A0A0S3QUE2_THET7|nr:thioesterase family protein [Thermosulfidibacter takaii]BAT71922.1 acyl-CoA thioester hydrolase [Thermosulfidibacter takaii ABI70S6]
MGKGFWVRFGDTDPYGVVYYAAYHRYAHQAVEDFLRKKGIDPNNFFKNVEKGYGMPVVASQGRFLKPVRYPAFLETQVEIESVSTSSITFKVNFYYEKEEVAYTTLTFVCINSSWQKQPLPDELRQLGEA